MKLEITSILKDSNGTITHVCINGHILRKSELIENMEKGYEYRVKNKDLILTKNGYVRTKPDKYLNNNLSDLPTCKVKNKYLL